MIRNNIDRVGMALSTHILYECVLDTTTTTRNEIYRYNMYVIIVIMSVFSVSLPVYVYGKI